MQWPTIGTLVYSSTHRTMGLSGRLKPINESKRLVSCSLHILGKVTQCLGSYKVRYIKGTQIREKAMHM